MKFLITGFEPFGGQTVNASAVAVETLAQQSWPDVVLETAVLPVDRFAGPDALIRAYIQNAPDAVLCLGEAGRRPALSIERAAINLLDFTIPDNSGNTFTDRPIQAEGPAAYFTTLPARAMHDAIQAAGVPVELSLSAGAFLCNQVIYELLHYIRQHNLRTPAGFIHLPWLPQQAAAARPLRPSMSAAAVCRGLTAAIQTIAREYAPHKNGAAG